MIIRGLRAPWLFILLVQLNAGCKTTRPGVAELSPSPGVEWNPGRMQRRIPILPKDWIFENLLVEANATDPVFRYSEKLDRPIHAGKYINMLDGAVHYETDTYYSGKRFADLSFEPGESPGFQSMTITYSYDLEREHKNPWHCMVDLGPQKGEYTLQQAEEILRGWGLKRLNDVPK